MLQVINVSYQRLVDETRGCRKLVEQLEGLDLGCCDRNYLFCQDRDYGN